MLGVDWSISQLGGGAENARAAGEQKKIVVTRARRIAGVNIVVEADNYALLSTLHHCSIVSIDLDANDVCGGF